MTVWPFHCSPYHPLLIWGRAIVVLLALGSPVMLTVNAAAPIRTDAVVLVNSSSAQFSDFQHFIQPYLDNFGVPYTIQDIATNAIGTNIGRYALIVIGHKQLDTTKAYLTAPAHTILSLAVSNGTGLVNFDSDLAVGTTPRYQFVQEIFNFTYGSVSSASAVTFPRTEPGSQLHYISGRHATNESVALRASMNVAGITPGANSSAVVLASGRPLLTTKKYGQGLAVQWSSYDWMSYNVLGPFWGLDDLVWRGMVWAARKPFVMHSLPNLVTMRVDDVEGPISSFRIANEVGFKPFLALFVNLIDETEAAELRNLVTNGNATASIHSWDYGGDFFYWNHVAGTPWPDNVMSNNFNWGTQWHINHGIPISKVVASHYSEFGLNAFAGLRAWGVEFFPIEIVPGGTWHTGVPWLMEGPYRLYQSGAGDSNWPLYYADFLTVPGHPEFNGVFFNQYTEVRDMTMPGGTYNCAEFCPDNDVAGSIYRGTRMLRRGLDGLCLATLLTHDRYIKGVGGSADQSNLTNNNWRSIMRGITNNLASYKPIYVTLDYGNQYARALKTSRVVSSDYDPISGRVTASITGQADLDTVLQIFTGADSSITNLEGNLSAFTNSGLVTITAGTLPVAPMILQQPISRTNHSGTPAFLSVGAIGTEPQYQWLKNDAPLGSATNAGLNFAAVSVGDAGSYRAVVSNSYGNVTSAVAGLTVGPPLLIQSIMFSNGSAIIRWSAIPGLSYDLQYKDFLNDSGWQVITPPVQAVTTSAAATDAIGPTMQRFYRVLVEP